MQNYLDFHWIHWFFSIFFCCCCWIGSLIRCSILDCIDQSFQYHWFHLTSLNIDPLLDDGFQYDVVINITVWCIMLIGVIGFRWHWPDRYANSLRKRRCHTRIPISSTAKPRLWWPPPYSSSASSVIEINQNQSNQIKIIIKLIQINWFLFILIILLIDWFIIKIITNVKNLIKINWITSNQNNNNLNWDELVQNQIKIINNNQINSD